MGITRTNRGGVNLCLDGYMYLKTIYEYWSRQQWVDTYENLPSHVINNHSADKTRAEVTKLHKTRKATAIQSRSRPNQILRLGRSWNASRIFSISTVDVYPTTQQLSQSWSSQKTRRRMAWHISGPQSFVTYHKEQCSLELLYHSCASGTFRHSPADHLECHSIGTWSDEQLRWLG